MDKEKRDFIKNEIIKNYGYGNDAELCARLEISLNSLRNRASRLGLKKLTVSNRIINGTKKCSRCGEVKPLGQFRRDKNQPSGYDYNCKSCRINPPKATPKTDKISVLGTAAKTSDARFGFRKNYNPIVKMWLNGREVDALKCKSCEEVKPLACFSKDKANTNGYKNICKACIKAQKQARKLEKMQEN